MLRTRYGNRKASRKIAFTGKLLATALISITWFTGIAQTRRHNLDHDSSYYSSYRNSVTGRGYFSRKYTTLRFDPPGSSLAPRFAYQSNTTFNLGIGATYHAFTVNIGVGVNRFNPEERGRTRYLDLQGHFYARKFNIDVLGEFYKGYYLTPRGRAAPPGEQYYKRSDLALALVGIAFYRAFNDRKFSYQAGLLQNEWQKKSAGSFLAGGEIYYGSLHADSALAPKSLDSVYARADLDKLHFFQFGPGIGYGYTLVIQQHFFILGSATVNLALRYTRERDAAHGDFRDHIDFAPNFILHAGLGYNTDNWCLSALWVSTTLNVKGPVSGYHYGVDTGNYRLIYARRFKVNRKVRSVLEPIPKLIGQ